MAATGAAQLRPKPGLFLWGHFDDNLGGHGRFSSAVRLMGVVPVSLNETAAALNPLLLCPISLWPDLAEVAERIGPRFLRSEPRRQALAYLQGLLSPVERKNSWQLAEQAGDPGPHRFQHLLGRAVWEADAVRDDLQSYVCEHLADPGGVLIVDETGFLKKGEGSVGVQRQYSGTAGRIENCQIGVFLAYQGARGHVFLDRSLYVPAEWAEDKPRRRAAGVPEEMRFATKPALARQMIERALANGIPARWVSGDSVYGNDGKLRLWLEEQNLAHVLGVSGNHYVTIGWKQHKASVVAAQFPP